ncbi:P1 family peptidase [Rummeliibacillus pycnus]|uniref:P1 family peptidase n=1 Tax=Rummeliibacillus pycnus TaxID=101070 RepID=UPI000C99E678|nr:P1 family peptidase [Rummeliibacillus pycnus]
MKKGQWNMITDVPNVHVGHVTLYEKRNEVDTICTGVTAILPHGGNLFEQKVPAASFVLNGFGKSIGLVQIEELGVMESPIMLTNTFSVAAVLEGTLDYMLKQNPQIGDSTSSLNIVVGECNDSHLNSMRLRAVKPEHAVSAIHNAKNESFEQGAVGAGKGMICYEKKGGIGSSSRIAERDGELFTVGVLSLTNFGNAGECRFASWQQDPPIEKPDGSVIIIVATNAPLSDRQLKRLAKRAAIGLGRTGTHIHNGSGDIIIAFSNAYTIPHQSASPIGEAIPFVRDDSKLINDLFQATIEATEESVYQSLLHAETTVGRKNRVVEKAKFEH